MRGMSIATPPVAAKKPHSITHHGITVTDDYAWLRDPGYPKVGNKEILAHLEAENAWFEAQMKPQAALTESEKRRVLPKPRAVARVRLRPGTGVITINKRPLEDYFPNDTHRMVLSEPLKVTSTTESYDIDATIHGGGVSGQAGAMRLGISRALIALDEELRPTLKKAGFLTRDSREKESKKYGLKKARKAPQYSKR